ncbi:MAG TPA: GntR family transcriptional regulator [Syntrophorhabdaceae bacterium]|nr:GntR family transcriptional regulator [Syntrophorhabdaceae bacterium]
MKKQKETTDTSFAADVISRTTPKREELLSDSISRSLRKMIGTGRFKPGQRINVEKLARELGVSRTPVWESIRGLLAEGIFLKSIPNRGVFVTEKPFERLRDVLQIRGALDRLACNLAIEHMNKRTLNKLSACLNEQLQTIEEGDITAYLSVDLKFHRLICEVGGNQYLKGLYESVTAYVIPTVFNLLPFLHDLFPVHEEIIEALAAGNAESVDKAITRHSDIILSNLEEQTKTEADRKEIVQRIKRQKANPGHREHRKKPK